MARRRKDYLMLRESTRGEKCAQAAWLIFGGAYSLLYWYAIGLQVWQLWRWP